MSFLDTLQKWARFYSEAKILKRVPQETTYTEEKVNGELQNQDILIDGESVKESLSAKEAYILAATQKERKMRGKEAKNLSTDEVMKLREKEEKARFAAHYHIKHLEGR